MQLPDGEYVWAEERFFLVSVSSNVLSRAQWTALEREVMADSRWWSLAELASTSETIYPEDLSAILNASGLSGSN
ncbi:DNA mismatch repair protein MutT [Paraburkholderia caffeinilytica]|nr:DNA mismatch repair protein MutT [Paraburkholderia caffeinilytica]